MGSPNAFRNLAVGIGKVGTVLLAVVAGGLVSDFALTLPALPGHLLPLFGLAVFSLGIFLEAWGTHVLWTRGGGTPNPRQPPDRLVDEGPYRFSRNPLYLARLTILVGAALLTNSIGILGFTLILFLVLHLVLLPREERRLRQRFAEQYAEYTSRVSRWITIRPRARSR